MKAARHCRGHPKSPEACFPEHCYSNLMFELHQWDKCSKVQILGVSIGYLQDHTSLETSGFRQVVEKNAENRITTFFINMNLLLLF